MARIRTIKPEFPQSESLGRVSRDARLLFVELFCLCDDEGRTRGASRLLASLLFPYDADAPALIDGWLAELEAVGCVRRYVADGASYLDIPNWAKHQKIDKPSKSKIPAFDEASRTLANLRDDSSLEGNGSGTGSGNGGDICPATSVAEHEAPLFLESPGCDQPSGPSGQEADGPTRLMQIWNEMAADKLRKCRRLTKTRRAAALARLREVSLSECREAIARIVAIPFFCGHNDRGWKATFDFLVKPDTITKVLEGQYDAGPNLAVRVVNGYDPLAGQKTRAELERKRQEASR